MEHFTIDPARFNDLELIASRSAPATARDALRAALAYLYLDDGPFTLPEQTRKAAEPHLDRPERLLLGWLAIRTKGALGDSTGERELRAARAARYRCQRCGFADVRVLNLDEIHGSLECLCANCHVISTRWRRVPESQRH